MLAITMPRLLVDVLEERRADGDVGRAADDRVVRIDAERREEGVHRAAEAAVDAGVAGEDLGQRAVDDEVDRQVLRVACRVLLDDAQAVAAEVVAP